MKIKKRFVITKPGPGEEIKDIYEADEAYVNEVGTLTLYDHYYNETIGFDYRTAVVAFQPNHWLRMSEIK